MATQSDERRDNAGLVSKAEDLFAESEEEDSDSESSKHENDDGAATEKARNGYFYCGRRLGTRAIPGNGGQCGPNSGPQCESCERFQLEYEKRKYAEEYQSSYFELVDHDDENDGVATDEQTLLDCLRANPFFGLFAISYCHPCDNCINAVFKVLPLLLLVVQIGIPIILWRSDVAHTHWICDRNGLPYRKLLMFLIGILYIVRLCVLGADKILRPTEAVIPYAMSKFFDQDVRFPRWRLFQDRGDPAYFFDGIGPRSQVGLIMQLDFFMAVPFEFTLYALNLWLVYPEDNILEMVLNALAIEFVTRLDEEFKEMYFKTSGLCVRNIIVRRLHSNIRAFEHSSEVEAREDTRTISCCKLYISRIPIVLLTVVLFNVSAICFVGSFVVSILATTIGTICKP